MPARATRRALLLGALAAAGVAGLGGCTGRRDPEGSAAYCVDRATLERRTVLGGVPMVYEPSGSAEGFWFEPGFAGQLDAWVTSLAADLGSAPTRLATYGSWIDGGNACDSWHHAGRAFDVAEVQLAGGRTVSCRYDLWRDQPAADLERTRRAYWGLAAGLHRRFAYVLTHLYDDQHANHIHVDNGRSGPGPSTFSARSRVQVQAVQAMLTYLWDEPVERTGRWDAPTRRASGRILDQLGLGRDLAAPEAWSGFLATSASRGR